MSDGTEEFDRPHVLFEETEDGFVMKMGGWEEVIEEGYSSFESIRKTFQTSDDVVPDLLVFGDDADEDEEDEEEEYILFKNPPQRLVDNHDWQRLVLGRLYNYLAEIGLFLLAEEEYEKETELLEDDDVRTLLVRQSAFFEDYLTVLCQILFQRQAGRVLSNKEMSIIAQMGHEDRTRMAYLLGGISEDTHGYLQQMVSARNNIAHNSWTDHTEEDLNNYRTVAEKVLKVLESYVTQPEEGEGDVPVIDLGVIEE